MHLAGSSCLLPCLSFHTPDCFMLFTQLKHSFFMCPLFSFKFPHKSSLFFFLVLSIAYTHISHCIKASLKSMENLPLHESLWLKSYRLCWPSGRVWGKQQQKYYSQSVLEAQIVGCFFPNEFKLQEMAKYTYCLYSSQLQYHRFQTFNVSSGNLGTTYGEWISS